MDTSNARAARLAMGLSCFAVIGAASCSTTQPLRVRDDGVLMPRARVRYDFDHQPGGAFVEASFMDFEGDDRQGVSNGENVDVGGVNFVGPNELQTDASVRLLDLAVGGASESETRRVAGFVGLEWFEVDLEVESATQQASEQRSTRSLMLGADASLALVDPIRVEARMQLSFSISGDSLSASLFEVGLGFEPVEHVHGFVGWSQFAAYDTEASNSDLDLAFSGPAVGLTLSW